MSRETRSNATHAIAFGVDLLPSIGAFVQVWEKSEEDEPYDEGEGQTNIIVRENHVSEERVIQLAKQYGIDVDPLDVCKIFD